MSPKKIVVPILIMLAATLAACTSPGTNINSLTVSPTPTTPTYAEMTNGKWGGDIDGRRKIGTKAEKQGYL